MRFDMTTIQRKLFRHRPTSRHFLKNALPDTALRPAIITIIDRRWWTVRGRDITPSTASFQYMQNAGDDDAVVNSRLAWPAMRLQELLEKHPLSWAEKLTRSDALSARRGGA